MAAGVVPGRLRGELHIISSSGQGSSREAPGRWISKLDQVEVSHGFSRRGPAPPGLMRQDPPVKWESRRFSPTDWNFEFFGESFSRALKVPGWILDAVHQLSQVESFSQRQPSGVNYKTGKEVVERDWLVGEHGEGMAGGSKQMVVGPIRQSLWRNPQHLRGGLRVAVHELLISQRCRSHRRFRDLAHPTTSNSNTIIEEPNNSKNNNHCSLQLSGE